MLMVDGMPGHADGMRNILSITTTHAGRSHARGAAHPTAAEACGRPSASSIRYLNKMETIRVKRKIP